MWTVATLAIVLWWPFSYRYSAGCVISGETDGAGVAALSGMGKTILYLSWTSRFARRGLFVEPVMPHEFPHPWIGGQWQGGRLWVSIPIAAWLALILAAASWHLGIFRSKRV